MVPSEHSPGPRPDDVNATLDAHLAELQQLLTDDRERISNLIASLTGDLTSIVEATQLTATDDEHDPEGSTIAFERSRTSTQLASANQHLVDVDTALQKIAEGTYGRCERCGTPISVERLLVRPAARTCIACAA